MSLTALERPRPRRLSKSEERAHGRYEKKIARAEREEEKMMRRVHKAFTFKGTPFDANHAAKIVGQEASWRGLSFHEALFCYNYLVTHPGRGFRF